MSYETEMKKKAEEDPEKVTHATWEFGCLDKDLEKSFD